MEELLMIKRQDIMSIADVIRSKTNISDEMTISEMVSNISNINNSSSAASIEVGEFSYTVRKNYEPGLNLYTLTSENLKSSSRNIIIVRVFVNTGNYDDHPAIHLAYRLTKEDNFIHFATNPSSIQPFSLAFDIGENYIQCCFEEYSIIEIKSFDFIAI